MNSAFEGWSPRVLVTGAAGQDGLLLLRLLVDAGLEVHGLVRGETGRRRVVARFPGVRVWDQDMRQGARVADLVLRIEPTHVFNFGGVSSIAESVRDPKLCWDVNVGSLEAILWAMRELSARGREVRLVNAASSAIYEGTTEQLQDEETKSAPISPYALSKDAAVGLIREARASWGALAASAILYNHESPLRDLRYVTRKVTSSVAAIAMGRANGLDLGDLSAARDWGWAPDYVLGMFRQAIQDRPKDFVFASGDTHTVHDWVELSFYKAGIRNWARFVRSEPEPERPADRAVLRGDSGRAREELAWRPSLNFEAVVGIMVDSDLRSQKDDHYAWQLPAPDLSWLNGH